MNGTKIARRSDALYYDNVNRRELCDMVAHLENDIALERTRYRHLLGSYRKLVALIDLHDDDGGDARD